MATIKQFKNRFEELKSECQTMEDAIQLAEFYAKRYAQLALWNESFAEKLLKDSTKILDSMDELQKELEKNNN